MTLDKALRDDMAVFESGLFALAGTDNEGRRILIYRNRFADPSSYSMESAFRALMYMYLSSVQEEESQKKGIVIISDNRDVTLKNYFGFRPLRRCLKMIKGSVPVRAGAVHLCNMPIFVRAVFPAAKLVLAPEVLERLQLHAGTEEHIMRKFEKSGLKKEMIPQDMGGDFELDIKRWIADRRAKGL